MTTNKKSKGIKMANIQVQTPAGVLKWVNITAPGKPNMSGQMKYVANLVLKTDSKECQDLIDKIQDFWLDNRPAKWPGKKPPKSLGYRAESNAILSSDGTPEYDEDGKPARELTGYTSFTFSTNPTFPDGSPKEISIYNSAGKKTSLGNKKIGNGTIAQIGGVIGLYTTSAPGGKVVQDAGVTLYLNSIRIIKLVEYGDSESWAAVDREDGWLGEEETWEKEAVASKTSSTPEATSGKKTPRL